MERHAKRPSPCDWPRKRTSISSLKPRCSIASRMSMTGADVKAALEEVTKISPSEFDSRYQKMLESVRQDVQLGQKVGITGTPTYFINGIRLGGFRPAAFDAVIAYELKKAGVTS